ncbi:MAG: hypothetical protein IKK39_10850, partial [Thermoguttaceae bacterium]|nr:hypothetical protein [Thermoguttaceae bacterium]
MKRCFRLPIPSILLALSILTPFDAFETPFQTFAVGQIAAQEPIATDEDAEIDFQLVAPGEFDLAPDDAPTLEIDDAAADRPAIPLAVEPSETAAPDVLEAETIDADEMERLSQDPLFQEFSAAFDQAAPLPTLPNLDALNAEREADALLQNGAAEPTARLSNPLNSPNSPNSTPDAAAKLASSTAALDEILAIAAVDLDSLPLSEAERAILTRLDAEIARLAPLWLDAELNRNVVGRRERVWERAETPIFPNSVNSPEALPLSEAPGRPFFARPDVAERAAVSSSVGVRFEVNDPKPVASASDWALAPAAPFFFEVSDPTTGDVFYTKAGDFEPFEGGAALVRGDRVFVATVEPGPGTPSGRAERTRILKNGQIQGVDATGKRVVDFNIGTFSLYLFDNPARLASVDGVFFVPTTESGEPRPAKLPANAQVGVESGRLLLSNGRPDEIFARIVVLCKSKKRLVEILTQPRLQTET